MGNGADEPIQFTRRDADRLTHVEDAVITMKRVMWIVVTSTVGGFITMVIQLVSTLINKG